MTQENFMNEIQILLPHLNNELAQDWIDLAQEYVEKEGYVGFESEGDETYQVEQWLSLIFKTLCDIKLKYGEDTAEQICEMAGMVSCQYPLEMTECAEYLKTGGTINEFLNQQSSYFQRLIM